MKKIVFAIVLSSFLPTIAIAEGKTMKNTNPNPSDDPIASGKHMQNTNPNPTANPLTSGKHMTNDNPYASHPDSNQGVAKTNQKTDRAYTIIKYEK